MGVLMGNLMRRGREQVSLSLEQAAQRVGVTSRLYRDMETGEVWPSYETYERICDLFGWPQTFVGVEQRGR